MNGPWVLADIGDLIGFLIFILFLIMSVVGSLANKWRQMQEEAGRRNRPQRPQAPHQPQAPRPQQRPSSPLEKEIADFLRTAGQQRPGSSPTSLPPRPPAPVRPPRPPVEKPVEVQPLEPRLGPVGTPLSARSLTTDIEQADDRMESHLRQAFTRDLTSRKKPAASTPPAPTSEQAIPLVPTAAAGLAALLASTDSLRNAVVLSEILNRPEHRWE